MLPMLKEYFEGKTLREISAQSVEKFKNDRMNTPTKKGTPRQPATVNRELTLLSSAYSLAVKYEKAEFQNKEIIEVRAAKKISLELTQRLAGNGDAEISEVKVLSIMGTILTGTENYFDIDLKNTEEKTIEGDAFAQWIYEVTPEEAGTPDLYLTLYLVLETPEGKYKYELPTIRKTVTVHSNAVATGTSFLTRNWKELIGFVIALGLIGASANWLRQWWEKRTTHEETNNAKNTDEES